MPLGQHLICRLENNSVIAPTPETRLVVTRLVFAMARSLCLLAYHLVDSHLHLVLLEAQARAMEFARNLESAITQRLDLGEGFARAHPEPIRDQRHLLNAFDYVLRQQSRHGLTWDPYLLASNIPDLLGMRVLGNFTKEHLRQRLPRVRPSTLLKYHGLESLSSLEPSLDHLVDATCAAAGLSSIQGLSRAHRAARLAALDVAAGRLPQKDLAALLDVTSRTLQRVGPQTADPALVRAVRGQLALRETIGQRQTTAPVAAADKTHLSAQRPAPR